MNDVGRTFGRDLRRFWPLALAAALIAFFLAFFPRLGLTSTNSSVIDAAETVRLIIIGLMTVAVVQEDLVVSDRAAWITRPMKASEVLGAKLLFLLVFLVLPFGLITAAGAHQYDLGAASCAATAGEHMSNLLVATLFFALLGAATPSLLASIIVFAISAAAFLVLGPYLSLLGLTFRLDGIRPAALGVMSILLLAVLGYHYHQRQLPRTAAAAVAALVILLLANHWIAASARLSRPLSGLTVSTTRPRGFVGNALSRPFPLSDLAVVGMEITWSAPPDADYYIFPDRMTFTAADGREVLHRTAANAYIPTDRPRLQGVRTAWDYYPQAVRNTFGFSRQARDPFSILAIATLPSATFAKYRGARGSLDLAIAASKEFVADQGVLGLEAGATAYSHGCRIRIESVRLASGGTVEVTSRAVTVRSRSLGYSYFLTALVNDRAGEVSLEEYGHDYAGYGQSYLMQDIPHSVSFAHRWDRSSGKVSPGVDAAWLKSAHLTYIVLRWAPALGTAELIVPDFAMPTFGGSL